MKTRAARRAAATIVTAALLLSGVAGQVSPLLPTDVFYAAGGLDVLAVGLWLGGTPLGTVTASQRVQCSEACRARNCDWFNYCDGMASARRRPRAPRKALKPRRASSPAPFSSLCLQTACEDGFGALGPQQCRLLDSNCSLVPPVAGRDAASSLTAGQPSPARPPACCLHCSACMLARAGCQQLVASALVTSTAAHFPMRRRSFVSCSTPRRHVRWASCPLRC
jgi:hypothetical protein